MTKAVLEELLIRARNALIAGDADNGIHILNQAVALSPDDARALNMLGNHALATRDFLGARSFFERATQRDPAPTVFLNMSIAARGLGDVPGEAQALDDALAADPYFQLALLQKARWCATHATRAAAAVAYSRFQATVTPEQAKSDAMQAALVEARALISQDAAALAAEVESEISGGPPPGRRFAECVDILLGRKRVYHSAPSGLYIPFLPEVPFFDRNLFPWFKILEAATEEILDELISVIAEENGIEPYISLAPNQPVNQWAALNHSRNWSAFFLLRDGEFVEENCARCPRTAEFLANLPLLDLPGRGPTAIFSILRPGAHIPPHTGATNSRAVIHLPLIVPPDCGFRVGATTREWRVGEAWAFDDTIEHEAWNRSENARAILILDAWNPYLTSDERDQVRALTTALDRHSGRQEWTA